MTNSTRIEDKDVIAWWRENIDHPVVEAMFQEVQDKREGIAVGALSRGDTEYEKGQVAALDWVLALPKDKLSEEK